MLASVSDEIRECYAHAQECARKAGNATSEEARQDFWRLEQNWLNLARSYEFARRLGDFQQRSKK